jgi:class 3 adenylate cyclase
MAKELVKGEKIKTLKNPLGKARHSQIELERRVFHLKTLYDVTREIGFLLDAQEIVKNLLLMVIGTFGVFRGFIVIVDTTKGKIEAVTERDIDKTSMETLFQTIESGFFLKEIKKIAGTQILGGRDKGQKKGKKKIFDLLSSLQIRIWIPFEVNKNLSGVIGLGDKLSGDPYTPDDRELLSTLANQGAVAIQNATTHQEVVRYAEELEASLKRIHILESIKSNLSKFVPRTVQTLIEEAPEAPLLDKHEADVSVLFADLTGYTRLSEQMEQDQLNRIVERYFGAFLDEILKNGGDVSETAGDGLMVIFQNSDPRLHANAAVLTALGIQRRTREINCELQGQLSPIGVHVGVNSGIASVGATKIEGMTGTRWTYTASGPTTNVAARLSALVQGEGVILSQETKTRIGDGFDLDDLGPQSLKNVSEPIRAFRLTVDGIK